MCSVQMLMDDTGKTFAAGPANYTHFEFTHDSLNNIVWNEGVNQTSPNTVGGFVNLAHITSFAATPTQEAIDLADPLSDAGDAESAFFNIHGSFFGVPSCQATLQSPTMTARCLLSGALHLQN